MLIFKKSFGIVPGTEHTINSSFCFSHFRIMTGL